MQPYARLIKLDTNDYFMKETNSIPLTNLANFLQIDSCYPLIEKRKTWINNTLCGETGGNITFIEKDYDKIIIGDPFEDNPYKNVFETTKSLLIDLLDQWKKLCELGPKEIWIFEKNGKVWLEGRNKLH